MRILITHQRLRQFLTGLLLSGGFVGFLMFLVAIALFGRSGIRWEQTPQLVGGTLVVLVGSLAGVVVLMPFFKAANALVDSVGDHKVEAAIIATEERCPTRGALSVSPPQKGELSSLDDSISASDVSRDS